MAKEKGFYKDLGLDVLIKEYETGKNPTEEVQNRNADFGVARSELILERLNKNIKYTQLFALCQASPVQLQAVKENGIEKISDLKGKKLLVYDDKTPIVSVESMLNSMDLGYKDFKLVSAKTYSPAEITDGYAHMVVGYSTITPYHLRKLGFTPVAFHPKDYGFDFYGDILFSMEDFIKKNPKVTKDFYSASIEGWKYAFANIDETIDVIKTKYDTQKLPRDLLEFEANEFKKLAFVPGTPFGNINPIKLEKIANTFKLLGRTKSTQNDFSEFIYKAEKDNSINLNSIEKKFIENNPVIKVGTNKNLALIDFIDDRGLHGGISHDILDFISQKTGLRFMYVESKNESLETLLLNKSISLFTTTKKEDKNILTTKPVFTLQKDSFVREDKNNDLSRLKTSKTEIYYALNKDSYILSSILTKAVNQMSIKQKEAIENKWVPKVIKEPFDWTIIWQIMSFFSLIIIFLLYKSIKQKKSEKERLSFQVDEKTKDLQVAVDEKALLLKELNHRVKNNMQTIVSLIRLQANRVEDDKLQNVFKTIQNRINAMSHLHELLYKQDNIKNVDANEYFSSIVEELKDTYDKDVEIELNISSELSLQQAIYCGLILNELVTNSLKYAFDGSNGKIDISLLQKNNEYLLVFKDNGKGFDSNIKTDSLGLILINRLVKRQLKGSLNSETINGVKMQIQWVGYE